MGFDWKKVLGVAAPMLGTALGGPLGGAAAATLVSKLGLTTANGQPVDPANQTDFETAMANALLQPAQIVQLRLAEQDFEKNMAELGLKTKEDLLKIDADDRANARDREVKTGDKTPKYLGWTVVLATFGLEGTMLFHALPPNIDPVILGRILGTLDMAVALVLGYYFGSSAGSAAKNDLLYKSAPSGK
jgi:hypothetical protein